MKLFALYFCQYLQTTPLVVLQLLKSFKFFNGKTMH